MFVLVEDVRLCSVVYKRKICIASAAIFHRRAAGVRIPALIRPWTIGQFNQVDGEEFGVLLIIFGLFLRFQTIVYLPKSRIRLQSYQPLFTRSLLR